MRQLPERAVEADRLLRVVLPGGSDEEDAREREDHGPGEVPDDAENRVPAALVTTHLLSLQLVTELPHESAVEVEQPRSDDGDPHCDHQVPPERLLECDPCHAVFLVASPSAAGDRLVSAKDERRADDAQPGVEQTAGDEADSLEQALVLAGLECPSERGLREAPDRVAAEPDSKRAKEEAAETGIRYLLERAGTILELAVLAERDLERQRRHEPERDPFGDEATSRSHRVHLLFAARLASRLTSPTWGLRLLNGDRRTERHQPEEPHDRGIAHADAAVRDPARDDPRCIRPMNADEPAAGPVREDRRARVQSESPRPVGGRVVAREFLADVELASRSGPVRLPDADNRAEDGPPVPVENRAQPAVTDQHPRVNRLERGQRAAGDPAGRAVREDRQPDADPGTALVVLDAVQRENRIAVELGSPEGDPREGARGARGTAARDRPVAHESPAVSLGRPVAERKALRI